MPEGLPSVNKKKSPQNAGFFSAGEGIRTLAPVLPAYWCSKPDPSATWVLLLLSYLHHYKSNHYSSQYFNDRFPCICCPDPERHVWEDEKGLALFLVLEKEIDYNIYS